MTVATNCVSAEKRRRRSRLSTRDKRGRRVCDLIPHIGLIPKVILLSHSILSNFGHTQNYFEIEDNLILVVYGHRKHLRDTNRP